MREKDKILTLFLMIIMQEEGHLFQLKVIGTEKCYSTEKSKTEGNVNHQKRHMNLVGTHGKILHPKKTCCYVLCWSYISLFQLEKEGKSRGTLNKTEQARVSRHWFYQPIGNYRIQIQNDTTPTLKNTYTWQYQWINVYYVCMWK